jgi:hypothetical protein
LQEFVACFESMDEEIMPKQVTMFCYLSAVIGQAK